METFNLINDECAHAMSQMDEDAYDAIVCDPPYAIAFMNAKWDNYGKPNGNQATDERKAEGRRYADENKGAPRYGNSHGHAPKRGENVAFQQAMTPIFEEALRVAKPGAYLLAFGSPRTFHRLACAIEDAGWVMRDCVSWVYGCLDEETEVLIDGEFVPYDKVTVGNLALGYDIGAGTFSWQRVEDTYLYDYDDTAYAIQSNLTDQLVSRNHRCIIERGGVEQFALAEQVAPECEARVPILEGLYSLLDHIPMPHEGAGSEEQDLLEGVCSESGQHGSEGAQSPRTEREMSGMRKGVLHTRRMEAKGIDTLLLKGMQWQGEIDSACRVQQEASREAGQDGEADTRPSRKNDRLKEPVVEGRRIEGERADSEAQGQACEMSRRISSDGAERWVDRRASTCGCPTTRETAKSYGGRTSCGPRPVKQRPKQPDVVCVQRGSQEIRADGFTRTTLARIEPVHYEGKMWCIKVATGAFVARRHGKVFLTGNSGFPKGLNVSKAFDRMGEHELAERWEGYNTQIKPAWEPIIMAQKPLDGTVAQNVMKHGVGAINVDACRIPTEPHDSSRDGEVTAGKTYEDAGSTNFHVKPGPRGGDERGRFPANFVHDGSDDVLALFPDSKGQLANVKDGTPRGDANCYGKYGPRGDFEKRTDSGSAARFFYCAKASKRDRNSGGVDNTHTTVKPNALMRWLVRLVCPQGGIVLDPFMGSGSTGVACMDEGMRFVGIELESEYVEIAEKRIRHAMGQNAQQSLF